MMNGGGAMIMVGILFAITGPIVAMLYYHRARVFDQLMDENKLLAHFKYHQIEWQRFAEDEKKFRSGEQRGMQFIVLFFSVIFGGLFWYFDPESGWVVALVLFFVNLLIMGVVFLNNRSYERLANEPDVECRVGANGCLLNNQLHVWVGWGARFEGARTNMGNINILEIVYSTPNRYSRQYYTIRIPIPTGLEKTADEVVKKLSSQ